MRDYKGKMARYKLSKPRYAQLRRFCLRRDIRTRMVVMKAMEKTTDDVLRTWIFRHVTSESYGLDAMEADGMPCNRDTFRVYRARFYWELDKILKGANISGLHCGTTEEKGR